MFKKTLVALLILVAFPLWAGPIMHHASGGGFFVLPSGSGNSNDLMFSFNARQFDAEGTAQGQFEQHNLSNGGIVHMEIFHMEFEGNQVYLFGEITKSINTKAEIGDERAVRLQDNGEGRDAALDMRSKLFKPPYNQPFDLMPLEGGNIKIR